MGLPRISPFLGRRTATRSPARLPRYSQSGKWIKELVGFLFATHSKGAEHTCGRQWSSDYFSWRRTDRVASAEQAESSSSAGRLERVLATCRLDQPECRV